MIAMENWLNNFMEELVDNWTKMEDGENETN
jgi:hypothetical protein